MMPMMGMVNGVNTETDDYVKTTVCTRKFGLRAEAYLPQF